MRRIKCDECGHAFYPGKPGQITGAAFELEDGTTINICRRCLIKANAEAKRDIKKALKQSKAETQEGAGNGNR